MGTSRSATFSLTNVSRKPWRFEWPANDATDANDDAAAAFAFSPRVGHLPPGTSTQITVAFTPKAPASHGLDAEHPPLEMRVQLAPVKAYYEGTHEAFLALRGGDGSDAADAADASGDADAAPDAAPAAAPAALPPRLLRAPRWTDQSVEERYVIESEPTEDPERPGSASATGAAAGEASIRDARTRARTRRRRR